MARLKLKVYDIEIEYEGNKKFLRTELTQLLERVKESHNDGVKKDLLGIFENMESEYASLESHFESLSRLIEVLNIKIQEFSNKSAGYVEIIKEKPDSQQALLEASRAMQEMQMSFNLQYLMLQNQMSEESRQFTLLSNVMKTKHDTARNAINNVR